MPTKTYPNKEFKSERREFIDNTVTRAKQDYKDKTLPKWERTAIRAQHLSNTEVGKVIARSNPNETKNYHTKLQRLEWDRRNREQELFWKQRQFFIERIFDENSQIRFNKARQKTFVAEPSKPQKDKRPEMFSRAKTGVDFTSEKHHPGEAKMFLEMTNDRSAIPRSPLIKKRGSRSSEPDLSKRTSQPAPYYPRTKSLEVPDSSASQVAVSYNIRIGSVSDSETMRGQSLPNAFGNILSRDEPMSSTTRWEGRLSDITENESVPIALPSESDLVRAGRPKGSDEDGNHSESFNYSSSTRKEIKWNDNQSGGSLNDHIEPASSGIPVCSNGHPVVSNGSFPVPYVGKTRSAVFERNNLDRKYSFVSSSPGQGSINESSAKLPQINKGIRTQSVPTISNEDINSKFVKKRASWAHALVVLKTKQSRSSLLQSDEEKLPDFATVVQRIMRSIGRAQVKGQLSESAELESPLSSNEVPTVDPESGETATRPTLQMPSASKTRVTPTPTTHTKTRNPETQDTDNIVKKIAVSLPSHLLATATNHGLELADKQFSARKEQLLGVEQRSTSRRASDDPRFQRLMGILSPRPADS